MSSTVTLSPPFLTTFPYTQPPPHSGNSKILLLKSHNFQPFLASRRTPNFPQLSSFFTFPFTIAIPLFCTFHFSFYNYDSRITELFNFIQGTDKFVDGPRNWSRSITPEFDDDQEVDEDEEDEEEEDRGLDLLVKFVQNVFRKISKRARKAVRAVLPVSISTKLVGFSVNGVLILAFFWVLKAFLEVVCTLGSVVFVSILLIRGIWTGITYMQEGRKHRINALVDNQSTWSGAQPAA